jgi:hypothetical protein
LVTRAAERPVLIVAQVLALAAQVGRRPVVAVGSAEVVRWQADP